MPTPENNGTKVYTLLVEYSTKTGHPTGRVKPNIPSDPNYIAPVVDEVTCPLPGSPVFNYYNVVVAMNGYTATVELLYSTLNISQTGDSAAWNIVDRTYDGVIFQVSAIVTDAPDYIVRITYQDGTVRETAVTGVNNTYIPGPFTAIQRLDIIPNTGDYNADYNTDFYN